MSNENYLNEIINQKDFDEIKKNIKTNINDDDLPSMLKIEKFC